MNTIGKDICPNCEGRGWNTRREIHGLTEFIYTVSCKFCGGTGKRDTLRDFVINNGFALVGGYESEQEKV